MIPIRIIAPVLAAVMLSTYAHAEVSLEAGGGASTQAASEQSVEAFAAVNPQNSASLSTLSTLIAEAMGSNPEIQAALREREAAQQRISPAEALDDPVLEAGVINAPLASSTFNREDMTMKMIGLSQRFPFPGKRGLRKDVAARDAESIEYGYQETVNRVVRDIKVAYFDLGLTLEMTRLVEKNKLILEELLHIAEDHYAVGRGNPEPGIVA